MLSQSPYYWGTIRKVVIAFGAVFSDIHINRFDKNGATAQTIEVPCEFGPKEKWLTNLLQNPTPGVDDSVAMVLPRMSYEITGFTYDPERKLTTTGRTVAVLSSDNNKTLKAQYNPVPYNIGFELSVGTKTIEDGLMIVEQIIPFFTPDYTITVKDVPELQLTKDLSIVLNGVSYEDQWTGTFQERRTVIWTLQFTVKAYLYPPVRLTKVNLRTNILWHLNTNLEFPINLNASINQNDQFDPALGDTPASIHPVHTQPRTTVQDIFGKSFIRNGVRNLVGTARIASVSNHTHTTTNTGKAAIRNPLNFIPGLQEEPIQTNTELTMQLQKGKASVKRTTTRSLTGRTSIIVHHSGFDDSFQPGAFQP